jgi:type IV pilus assembly protein PilB
MARVRIGELLMSRGRIDELQLQSALAHQRRWGGRLGRAVVQLGFMDERTLLEILGEQLDSPYVTIGDRYVDPSVLALVPRKLILSRRVIPLARLPGGRRSPLVVALADPADLAVLDELAFVTGHPIKPVLATETDIDLAIHRLVGDGSNPPHHHEAIELPEATGPGPVQPTGRRRGRGSFSLN